MIIFVYMYSSLPERQDTNLCSVAGEGIRQKVEEIEAA
jgi:hypothetical protein